MRAIVLDGSVQFTAEYAAPQVPEGWARIAVRTAGICGTDLALIQGYAGYRGVLGHEFVGVVDQCTDAEWIDKRVVGEINVGCRHCDWCAEGLTRHCPNRRALGIRGLDGCMAEHCVLPVTNLREVAAGVPDERAVFVEPLSAACEILAQLSLTGSERIMVLGDGRLGILCAWVLLTVAGDVTLIGRHENKLAAARWRHLRTVLEGDAVLSDADVVVDATGSPSGLANAMALCRPRGTIVLKSAGSTSPGADLTPAVVREQTLIGSRCGDFEDGLRMLAAYPDLPLERLVSARYPLEEAMNAFQHAATPGVLKVLFEV